MLQIEKHSVVEFTFALVDEAGEMVADTERHSTAILHGAKNVIPGIEKALLGRETGDKFVAVVPPEEGYGPRRDNWTQRVSKKYFRFPKRIKVGAVTNLRGPDGERPVTILKVGGKFVDVDLNHPHAGQTLRFDIEITSVREATTEERAHGHAHGAHGAQH